MVLYKSKEVKINDLSRKISLMLSDRERNWNENQGMKLKERLDQVNKVKESNGLYEKTTARLQILGRALYLSG